MRQETDPQPKIKMISKILIAEEAHTADLLASIFKAHLKGVVTECASHEDTIALIENPKEEISLVITNFGRGENPPGKIIQELVTKLRPGLPVLILTGGFIDLTDFHPENIMRKPFENEAFIKRVTELICSPGPK